MPDFNAQMAGPVHVNGLIITMINTREMLFTQDTVRLARARGNRAMKCLREVWADAFHPGWRADRRAIPDPGF